MDVKAPGNERFLVVPAGSGRTRRAALLGMTTLYEFFNKRLGFFADEFALRYLAPCFIFGSLLVGDGVVIGGGLGV